MRIRGFKEVCARDGLEMNRELDLLITTWLTEHHWPPGNPQTQINGKWENKADEGQPKPSAKAPPRADLNVVPTDLLVLRFNSIDTSPGDKLEIGLVLRKRGAYPKDSMSEGPINWTPRYGSG
jgi:hypothetical protein